MAIQLFLLFYGIHHPRNELWERDIAAPNYRPFACTWAIFADNLFAVAFVII